MHAMFPSIFGAFDVILRSGRKALMPFDWYGMLKIFTEGIVASSISFKTSEMYKQYVITLTLCERIYLYIYALKSKHFQKC